MKNKRCWVQNRQNQIAAMSLEVKMKSKVNYKSKRGREHKDQSYVEFKSCVTSL